MGWAQLRQLGLLVLVLGNVGALVLTIVAGWFFAGAALRPVAQISRQAGRISATNLGRRLSEGNGRDELAQLARVFNTLLAGLEQAFEGQKSFLAHASHELRTPLTTLTGTLETALAYDVTLEEARQSLARSLDAAGGCATGPPRYPTIKILALSFLIMIGLMLVIEAGHQHIEKGYLYFAMAFSLLVELLNIRLRRKAPAGPGPLPDSSPD